MNGGSTNNQKKTKQKNRVVGAILLLLPVVLFTALLTASLYLCFETLVKDNVYFSLLVRDNTPPRQAQELDDAVNQLKEPEYTEKEEGSMFDTGFPMIDYGSQWATLNVDGWSRRDIPVFFGDQDEYLNRGAGMWLGSRFCGQNAKIVLSAHVLTDFYELEDTQAGTLVTMDTSYGKYVYKIREIVTFDKSQEDMLFDKGEGDVLFMYTCYPRSSGLSLTPTRLAAICDLVEGYEYEAYQ